MTKKIVISGYYGFDNFGDEAILKVLVESLKNGDYDISVISNNPSKTASTRDVKCVHTFDICAIWKTLKQSDVLISGGGSLLQDVTSIKSLLYYLFVIFSAQILRKKVIIFAQGIGPINNVIGCYLTKLALKNSQYVTVRDEKSLLLLKNWGIDADLVADPVWGVNVSTRKNNNYLGIQLRQWQGITDKFLEKLAYTINENFGDSNILIYSFQNSIDLEICEKFRSMLQCANSNNNVEILQNLSIDETIESFSSLDYLIAMRYHACLLALKYGIPTLALSYDEKVKKIADKFDLPCSFLSETDDFDALIATMKNIKTADIVEKAGVHCFDFSKFIEKIED